MESRKVYLCAAHLNLCQRKFLVSTSFTLLPFKVLLMTSKIVSQNSLVFIFGQVSSMFVRKWMIHQCWLWARLQSWCLTLVRLL